MESAGDGGQSSGRPPGQLARRRKVRVAREGRSGADSVRVDPVAVWVTYQLIGGTLGAERHDISRTTLYRCVREVDADPARVEVARAALAEQRRDQERRRVEVVDAAHEALLARIRTGKLHSRHLVALALSGVMAPAAHGKKQSIEAPACLTTPREDSGEDARQSSADSPTGGAP